MRLHYTLQIARFLRWVVPSALRKPSSLPQVTPGESSFTPYISNMFLQPTKPFGFAICYGPVMYCWESWRAIELA